MPISRRMKMILNDLITLVRTLRKKCPWDREQTISSLKNNVVEEAYELVEAIEENNVEAIKEEIGDILFLGIFLATVLEDERRVQFDDTIAAIIQKYKEKHPHVFEKKELSDQKQVLTFWHESKEDIFIGIPRMLPALLAAKVIQERASRVGFDWDSHAGPLAKINEELQEIEKSAGSEEIFREFGDLLFACVNLARHLSVDPEDALRRANKKFVRRFRAVKLELEKRGKTLHDAELDEMDSIWNTIKQGDE
jgi:tetrapyrrole methylase family protein/MazG family protein